MATNPKLSAALRGNQNAKGPHKKGALDTLVKGSTAAGESMNAAGRKIAAKVSGIVSDAKTNVKFAMRSPRDAASAAKESINGAVKDLANKAANSSVGKQVRGRFGDGGGGTARKVGAAVGGAVAKAGMTAKGAVKGARTGLAVAKGTNAVTNGAAAVKGVFKKETTGAKVSRLASNASNVAKATFRGAKIGAKIGSTVASATGAGRMQGAAAGAAASKAVRSGAASVAAGAKSAATAVKKNYPEVRGRIADAQVKAGDAIRRKFNLKARRKGM